MNRIAKISLVVTLLVLAWLFLFGTDAARTRAAGPWYVAPGGSDSSNCLSPATACASINGAMGKASSGDVIYLAVGMYTGTGTAVVPVNKSIALSGGWDSSFATQSGMSTVDGEGARRVISTTFGTITSLDRLIIQNGAASDGGAGLYNNGVLTVSNSSIFNNVTSGTFGFYGGGVRNYAGTLFLTNSQVISNASGWNGGGIYNDATMTVTNSTISGNQAGMACCSGGGGGAGIDNVGTLTLNNSTVSNNRMLGGFSGLGILNYGAAFTMNNSTVSGNIGGTYEAVYASSGTVAINNSTITNHAGYGYRQTVGVATLRNTILAGNGTLFGNDCLKDGGYPGSVTSLGYNIIQKNTYCTLAGTDLTNTDPKLGPLQNNGGVNSTHSLLQGSPAIDAGNPAGCTDQLGNPLNSDQRGFPRYGRCDIGAYELQPIAFSTKSVNPSAAYPGAALTFTVTLTNPSMNDASVILTDTVPVSVSYVNGSLYAPSGSYGYASGVITWTGVITANSNVNLTFGTTIKSDVSASTSITNSALISDGAEVFSRSATATVLNPLASSLKLVNKSAVFSGDLITYTIALTNSSPFDVNNIIVTDTLPTNLAYSNGSLNATSGSYGFASGVITWTGTINAGSNASIFFSAHSKSTSLISNTTITNSAAINGQGEVFARTASVTVSPQRVDLPLLTKCYPPPRGIYGNVTAYGAPAPGVLLYLRLWNGSAWSTAWTILTDASGNYAFATAPSLTAGQRYHVLYLNSSDPSRLAGWQTRDLLSYDATACNNIDIGDFDVANIALVSPPSYATVSLPQSFQWGSRSATPTDSYEYHLFDPANPSNDVYTPPLGYVSGVTLNTLPGGFSAGVQYGWYVADNSPDGGWGLSFYYRPVTFSNTGFGPTLRLPTKPSNRIDLPHPKVSR